MRGQISLEFMVFIGILLLITSLASYIAVTNYTSIFDENVDRDARTVVAALATEINIASEIGDGYSHNFSLPVSLYGGINYSISVYEQRAYITWINNTYSLPLLSYNTTGVVKKTNNMIRNTRGVIIID
jgi:uncharacterized protein (UPF0333 family)